MSSSSIRINPVCYEISSSFKFFINFWNYQKLFFYKIFITFHKNQIQTYLWMLSSVSVSEWHHIFIINSEWKSEFDSLRMLLKIMFCQSNLIFYYKYTFYFYFFRCYDVSTFVVFHFESSLLFCKDFLYK